MIKTKGAESAAIELQSCLSAINLIRADGLSRSSASLIADAGDSSSAASPQASLAGQQSRMGEIEANSAVRRRIAESYPFRAPTSSYHLGELGDLEDEARDPFLLKNKIIQEDDQQAASVAPTSKLSRAPSIKSLGGDAERRRKVKCFYQDQNARIANMLKPLVKHAQEAKEDHEAHKQPVKIAVTGSLVVNCVLAVLQIYAAVSSLSLSFFASAIDAIFDPCVTVLLWYLTRRAKKADPQKWPAGGARMVNAGSTVYSMVMAGASVILIVQSIQELASHKPGDVSRFYLPSTVVVAICVAAKFCMFCYCYGTRTYGPECRVLYEDHRNDLGLNSFALITNALGGKLRWWIDPAGAILISIILIYLWGGSALHELRGLAGIAAPRDLQQLVIYKAMTFSDQISQVDSCKVYHSGSNYVIEVDIVLPPETSLAVSHDISQMLQDQLETLPNVDRCYVHVDHESSHTPEHRKFY